jgi:hypothetical protein
MVVLSSPGARSLASEAEIEDLHAAVAGQHDVAGFEVAMHDFGRVGGGEAVANLRAAFRSACAVGADRVRELAARVSPSTSSETMYETPRIACRCR